MLTFENPFLKSVRQSHRKSQHTCCASQRGTDRDFPGGPVVKTLGLPMQGARVRSLVRELRAHMLQGMARKQNKTLN